MQSLKNNTPKPGPALKWSMEYIFSEVKKDLLANPVLTPDNVIEIYGIKLEMDQFGDVWQGENVFETLPELCNHILQFRPLISNNSLHK